MVSRDHDKVRDPDGIRTVEHRKRGIGARWLFFVAAAAVVAGIVFVRLTVPAPRTDTGDAPRPAVVRPKVPLPNDAEQSAAQTRTSPRTRQLRAVHVDRSSARQGDEAQARGATPSDQARVEGADAEETKRVEELARDMIDAAKQSGETRGLAAFPPPGTDPIKTGIVVPDDYELPAGYVRYYQITDDGRRLEPILMFSPDYEFLDENGQPVPLPESGIVPPEMAPPGLAVDNVLEVPERKPGEPIR